VKDSRDISFQCIDAVEISLLIEKEGLAFYEKAARNDAEALDYGIEAEQRSIERLARLLESEKNSM